MSLSVPLPRTKLLIDGDWSDADNGDRFTTLNPATEEVIAEVAQAGTVDADAAVDAARRALTGPWGTMTGAQRGRAINAWPRSCDSASRRWFCWRVWTPASRSRQHGARTSPTQSTRSSTMPVGPTSSRGT